MENDYKPKPEEPHSLIGPEGHLSLVGGYEGLADPEHPTPFQVIKRGLEVGVVALEVAPTNEALRFAAFGAAQAIWKNSLLSGAVFGVSTLLIEGGAAVAAADLLDTQKSKKAIGKINKKLERIIPSRARMSPIAEAGVGYLGGSAIVLAEKQREDPSRTKEQNTRHGLFTAGWLAGTCTVQGVLMAEGVADLEPKKIGITLIGLASVIAAARWAKNRMVPPKPYCYEALYLYCHTFLYHLLDY